MALSPIELPDAQLFYDPAFLCGPEADDYFLQLQQTLDWRQDWIQMFGRRLQIPRLQAFYGDQGCDYRYSGLDLHPLPWTPALESLRRRIEAASGCRFNAVLANLYRHGDDSVGWHADNEKQLGGDPVLGSLTLGCARRFCLRHNRQRQLRHQLQLAHGSLLLMAGSTQHHWQHALPKQRGPCQPRINLSFRWVLRPAA